MEVDSFVEVSQLNIAGLLLSLNSLQDQRKRKNCMEGMKGPKISGTIGIVRKLNERRTAKYILFHAPMIGSSVPDPYL
jgi:hypothetical protein